MSDVSITESIADDLDDGGPFAVYRPPDDERKAVLARTIQTQIVGGARIESQTDFQAVMLKGKPINHVLHLILTLVTFGFWGIVWLVLALTGGVKRSIVSVDEFGFVNIQEIK